MKRIVTGMGAFVCALGLAGTAWATNGYQLIGTGQMQKSMGGAVTAAPMDTMTAISNPAGMARVGNRADFSMEAFMPKRSADFSNLGAGSTEGGTELYGIPSVGWVANAFGRDDMVFGGGMFATSGMGVDYDQTFAIPAGAMGGGSPANNVDFSGYSSIAFWKMAPTVAWNQSDALSIGVSLNVDYQSLAFKQSFIDNTAGVTLFNMDLGRPTSQLGYGATVGVLYDVNDALTVGANYSTKQLFGDAEFRLRDGDLNTTMMGGGAMPGGTYKMDMDYPQQAALGVAYRPQERVLVAFDVKWIDWSNTHDTINLTGPGGTLPLAFGWEDQTIYALGVQYAATDALTLRAGFNMADAPIKANDAMQNVIFPAIVKRHAAFGADYRLGDHWGVGGTFMKAFKESLTETDAADLPVTITLEETSVGLLLYYLM